MALNGHSAASISDALHIPRTPSDSAEPAKKNENSLIFTAKRLMVDVLRHLW
jgi:hypothetical protein